LVKLGASLIHLLIGLNFDGTPQGVPSFLTLLLMLMLSPTDKAMEVGIASSILLHLMSWIYLKLGRLCTPHGGKAPCKGGNFLYTTIESFTVASATGHARDGRHGPRARGCGSRRPLTSQCRLSSKFIALPVVKINLCDS
jgi:hypothetical protein